MYTKLKFSILFSALLTIVMFISCSKQELITTTFEKREVKNEVSSLLGCACTVTKTFKVEYPVSSTTGVTVSTTKPSTSATIQPISTVVNSNGTKTCTYSFNFMGCVNHTIQVPTIPKTSSPIITYSQGQYSLSGEVRFENVTKSNETGTFSGISYMCLDEQ